MKLCLETAGTSLQNVMKCNVYCTSVEHFAAVRRRFAHGFFYRVNYTFSKSIDEASQIAFGPSVRYGLEILKTMALYKLHEWGAWSSRIFRKR